MTEPEREDRGYERDDRGEELQGVARLSHEFKARIKEIHADGWWHEDNYVTYLDLAERLLDEGLTEDVVLDILTRAFDAAADEYGA